MLTFMVKEADIDRIAVPDGYDVLDATALGNARVEARYGARLPVPAQLRADTEAEQEVGHGAGLVRAHGGGLGE
jgi:hypothetical protein